MSTSILLVILGFLVYVFVLNARIHDLNTRLSKVEAQNATPKRGLD